jgi:glycosyltransferase involved in cell wall biosynthesis
MSGKVYLHPENPGHLGDDTFWYWFKREFPDSSWNWHEAGEGDVVLQYSVLGRYEGPAKYIALCWEMYPEMQRKLPTWVGNWDEKVARCMECAANTEFRTVPTKATLAYYEHYGPVRVLPLPVDTDVFRPLAKRYDLREKYGIPQESRVGFWSGTTHHMKGYDLLEEYARAHPDTYWICCWKQPSEAGHKDGAYNTVSILQPHMNELMNCADFFLSTGRLYPLFLVEWEALSSGLTLVNAPGVDREAPSGSGRLKVFEMGFDRTSARHRWAEYVAEVLSS